jgi:hypothetical protein
MGKRAIVFLMLMLLVPTLSVLTASTDGVGYLSNSIETTVLIVIYARMPQVPFTIYGHAGNSEGTTVIITDAATGKSIETTTRTNGFYVVNLGNINGAWSRGDKIFVNATSYGSVSFTIPYMGYIFKQELI